MIARRVVAHGRVQGVGFRYAMVDAAAALGVAGWVRNRRDGTVEVWVQGADDAVERAIAWTRRGPPAARVDRLDVVEVEADTRLVDFRQGASA